MATSPPSGQASSARVSAARAASARRRRAAREGRATSSTSARRRSRRHAGLDTELPVDFWPTGLNLASAASAASAAARAALSGTRSALSASAAPLPTAGSPLPSAAVSSSDVTNVDIDIASGPAADPSDGALTRDEITTIIGVDPTLPMSRGGMPPSEQRRRLARYRAIVASEAQLRRELSMSAQQVEAKIASAVATAAADPEKVAAEARRMTAAAVAAKEEEMRGQMQAMLLIQARALGLEDQLLHQLAEHRRLRLDSLSQKTHTFVSIAIEIGDIDISSYGGELGDQDTLRREWRGTAAQLPLFCNCRFTGIRADGAHFGSCSTRGCVRLLFAFYTGSSDLGFNTNSILRRQIAVFCCVF